MAEIELEQFEANYNVAYKQTNVASWIKACKRESFEVGRYLLVFLKISRPHGDR